MGSMRTSENVVEIVYVAADMLQPAFLKLAQDWKRELRNEENEILRACILNSFYSRALQFHDIQFHHIHDVLTCRQYFVPSAGAAPCSVQGPSA